MDRNLQRTVTIGALLLLLLPLAAELFHTHRHEAGTGRVLLSGDGESDQTGPCESTHLHRGSSPPTGHCPVCLLHRLGGAETAGPVTVDAIPLLSEALISPDRVAGLHHISIVPPSRAPPSA